MSATADRGCKGGKTLTPVTAGAQEDCSTRGNNVCDCEGFCVSNKKANAYYTAMNEIFNNYTRFNSFDKMNFENVGFSSMVFVSSILNFKSPGSQNPGLETVS